MNRHRRASRLRRDAVQRSDKIFEHRRVAGIPFREYLDARLAVGRDPAGSQILRQIGEGDRLCLDQLAEQFEAIEQPRQQRFLQIREDAGPLGHRGAERLCEPRAGLGVGMRGGEFLQRVAARGDRRHHLRVAWRRLDRHRSQARPDKQRQVLEDRELLRLIGRDEACRGYDLGNLGQLAELVGKLGRCIE